MSSVAKIFVVINMLLAFMFLTVSLVLYSKKVNWVEQTQKQTDALGAMAAKYEKDSAEWLKRDADQKDQIVALDKDLKAEKAKSEGAQANNDELKKMNDGLRGSVDNISDKIEKIQAQLASAEEQAGKLREAKEKAEQERDQASASMEFARVQAIEVTADLKEAEAQMVELSKVNADLMEQVMQMRAALARGGSTGESAVALAGPATPISARVLQVAPEVGIVILNVGEKDQVKAGMEFVISRGDAYVGKVKVRNLYQDMSSAVVIPEMTKAPIQVSDMAQTM